MTKAESFCKHGCALSCHTYLGHSHTFACALTLSRPRMLAHPHFYTTQIHVRRLQSHFREHSGFLSSLSSEMFTAEGLGECSTRSSPFRTRWQERKSQATGVFTDTSTPHLLSCWPVWICCWCHMEEITMLLSVIVIHCFKPLHSESHSILLWCASLCPPAPQHVVAHLHQYVLSLRPDACLQLDVWLD